MKYHWPIAIIIVIAAILIFANLGNQYLWQDEAETATLAKNVLKYGFPRALDGENLINPSIRTGYGADHGWRYHPWGQFYLTALSFKALGVGTFSARFPFAVLGVINLLLLYLFVYHLTSNRFVAGCSAFLTASTVPYLLFMRQCRYYAPSVFLVLAIMFAYSKFREKGTAASLSVLTIALIALGYTVHGMFVPVFAAIMLHCLLLRPDKVKLIKICSAGVIASLSVLPWFLYSNSFAHTAAISFGRVMDNLEFQIRMINKFIFPMLIFAAFYAVRSVYKKSFAIDLTRGEKNILTVIAAVIIVSIGAFSIAEERNFRYLVYFIPLFAIVQALILLRLAKKNRYIMSVFIVISLFTGIFNMGYPNFYFPKYLYEITHDYDGPVEGIVKFLEKNAEAGETVKIIYGDLPLMFYTGLNVDNSQIYDKEHMPEWIVFRRGWHETLDNPYYSEVKQKYKKHILDYPDIKWENRPGDMDYHRFATDKEAPGVIIFERRDA